MSEERPPRSCGRRRRETHFSCCGGGAEDAVKAWLSPQRRCKAGQWLPRRRPARLYERLNAPPSLAAIDVTRFVPCHNIARPLCPSATAGYRLRAAVQCYGPAAQDAAGIPQDEELSITRDEVPALTEPLRRAPPGEAPEALAEVKRRFAAMFGDHAHHAFDEARRWSAADDTAARDQAQLSCFGEAVSMSLTLHTRTGRAGCPCGPGGKIRRNFAGSRSC